MRRFPEGQLFGDLQGYAGGRTSSAKGMLGRFLRALGVAPDAVPADLAEQGALFRSLTTDRRILVVVDNATAARDVLALLPGPPHALVVVTSRHRLPGLVARGARVVDVAPLAHRAGFDLVAGVLGENRVAVEPTALDSVVRACAGLPLALWLAAAQLASRPLSLAADLAARLTGSPGPLDSLEVEDLSVRAALDLSYENLHPVAARALALVSGYPGPDFTVAVAAAAAQLELDETERSLTLLSDVHLVEELGRDRFRLHDLIRLHARERAERCWGIVERDAADLRMARWYLAAALAADKVIMPTRRRLEATGSSPAPVPAFSAPGTALDWAEANLPHFLAVVWRHAAESLGYRIVEALWGLFLHRKHYTAWLASHELVVGTAGAQGDVLAETLLLNHLGLGFHGVGRLADAADVFTRALGLHRAAGDRVGEATALNSLGLVLLGGGSLLEAAEHFRLALDLQLELGQLRGEALTRLNLATTALARGETSLQEPHLRLAESIFRSIGDHYNVARVEMESAALAVRAGQLAAARELLDSALTAMSSLKADKELARIHRALADLAVQSGDMICARRHLDAVAQHESRLSPPLTG
ncbi:tetratricopeptide repeat protein [Lentzea sp. NPDC058436]|uniref:tetratricopeptide repeat protein n=1 Tax=Lentzea sp. NPDC058436 TaxID=3346499 RepID=UPI00365B3342